MTCFFLNGFLSLLSSKFFFLPNLQNYLASLPIVYSKVLCQMFCYLSVKP